MRETDKSSTRAVGCGEIELLFLITQIHTPESCPIDEGGLKALHKDPAEVEGLELKAIYGDFPNHIVYYIVETEDRETIDAFLRPGWLRCTSETVPITQSYPEE